MNQKQSTIESYGAKTQSNIGGSNSPSGYRVPPPYNELNYSNPSTPPPSPSSFPSPHPMPNVYKIQNTLQGVTADIARRVAEQVDISDIRLPSLSIVQKGSITGVEGEIKINALSQDESYISVRFFVLNMHKQYQIQKKLDTLKTVPFGDDLMLAEHGIDRINGKLVYTADPQYAVIFMYIYEGLVFLPDGQSVPCMMYCKGSNLDVAKYINTSIKISNHNFFQIGSVEVTSEMNSWFKYTALKIMPISSETEEIVKFNNTQTQTQKQPNTQSTLPQEIDSEI